MSKRWSSKCVARPTGTRPASTKFALMVSYTPAAKFCRLEKTKMECGFDENGIAPEVSRNNKKSGMSGIPCLVLRCASPISSSIFWTANSGVSWKRIQRRDSFHLYLRKLRDMNIDDVSRAVSGAAIISIKFDSLFFCYTPYQHHDSAKVHPTHLHGLFYGIQVSSYFLEHLPHLSQSVYGACFWFLSEPINTVTTIDVKRHHLLTGSWQMKKNSFREFLQEDIFSSWLEHICCCHVSHVCSDMSSTSAEMSVETSSMGHCLKKSYSRDSEFFHDPEKIIGYVRWVHESSLHPFPNAKVLRLHLSCLWCIDRSIASKGLCRHPGHPVCPSLSIPGKDSTVIKVIKRAGTAIINDWLTAYGSCRIILFACASHFLAWSSVLHPCGHIARVNTMSNHIGLISSCQALMLNNSMLAVLCFWQSVRSQSGEPVAMCHNGSTFVWLCVPTPDRDGYKLFAYVSRIVWHIRIFSPKHPIRWEPTVQQYKTLGKYHATRVTWHCSWNTTEPGKVWAHGRISLNTATRTCLWHLPSK